MLLNAGLTTAQKLDLKKSLHKDNTNEQDLVASYIDPRAVWELKLGLEEGASIKAANVTTNRYNTFLRNLF